MVLTIGCVDPIDLSDPSALNGEDAEMSSSVDAGFTEPDTGAMISEDAEPAVDMGFEDAGFVDEDTGVEEPPVEDAGFGEDAHPMDAEEHPDADPPLSDCQLEGADCVEPIEAACPDAREQLALSCEGAGPAGLICCLPL